MATHHPTRHDPVVQVTAEEAAQNKRRMTTKEAARRGDPEQPVPGDDGDQAQPRPTEAAARRTPDSTSPHAG